MWKVTTGPTVEPITLVEIKNYLKIDFDTDDDLLTRSIKSARQWVEVQCNRGLLPQTITQVYDGWPGGREFQLNVGPVRSVTAIYYRDNNGSIQTWASGNYTVDNFEYPARVQRKSASTYPTLLGQINSVSAVYTVGVDNASDVPGPLVDAMYLEIADAYENRQNSIRKHSTAAEYKIQDYRTWLFR